MIEVKDDFIFRNGKHTGKTYKFVKETNPSYICWAEENAPGLLKEPKKKVIKETQDGEIKKWGNLSPNLNFFNEGKNNQ